MWRRPAGRVSASLLAALLSASADRAAAGALPSCTFEACPQCLPDARTNLTNLTLFGPDEEYHQVALRIARADSYWDVQSIYGQIVGILVSEQLGVQIQYIPSNDDYGEWLGINNCIGWQDYECNTWEVQGDAALQRKMFGDVLADIMVGMDMKSTTAMRATTEGTELQWDEHPGVNLGPSGYTSTESLFAPMSVVSRAMADGLDLRWFPSYEVPKARSYFDKPQRLIDDGAVSEADGCSSDISLVQNSMDSLRAMGYTCRRAWWLTPACEAFGDQWASECIVMIDDVWGYWKPEVYEALAGSQAPIAKIIVGYDVWAGLIAKYNVTHNWWLPDASLGITNPQYVQMPVEVQKKPGVQVKAAWAPVLEADPKVSFFLKAVILDQANAEGLMKKIATAYANNQKGDIFQKIACDWLREKEDVWRDWMPSAKSCVPGQVFDNSSQHCVACPRGTAAAAHKPVCLKCTAGFFTEVAGAMECTACIPGQFSSATGASTGSVCQRCPEGKFAAGAGRSACEACNVTFTTLFPGATGSSDCTCAAGKFLQLPADGDLHEAFCTDCVKGLLCPGGNGRPLQAVGFAAADFTYGGPTTIVACATDVKCPGGTPLGTCPNHHQGVACDVCAEGYFAENGRCVSCQGRNLGMTIGPLVFLVVVGGALVLRAVRHRVGVGTSSAVTLMLTCSLTISTLQMVTSFEKLLRNWPQPLASIYGLLRFFTIDLNVTGLACMVRLGRPEIAYLGSLLLHPAFAAALVVCVWALRLLGWSVPAAEVINMQGLVISAVYIALTIVSLRPWQCNANPDGTSSVASSRAIICWSSQQHKLMIGMSVVALCVYVVGAFTMVAWATWVYPSKIHSSKGEVFIRRFRFLYFRFNSQHYWFVIPFMIRSVLVSVLPVVLVNEQSMCLMLLILVVGTGCAVQCAIFPWRESWINYLDAMASLSVLLLLAGGALVMDADQHHTEEMVQYFYMALILGLAACLVAVAVFSLWRWLFPPRQFGVFLCHHKDGAAILARWCKMLLTEFTSERVFLDSDELDRLDKIFEVVARETKYVVLLLTEHTMERIWCAGEMATAVRYKVDMVVVACNDYKSPTDDFINNIASLWTEEQQNQAFVLGVCIRDIQDGYRAIRNIPTLALDREQSQASQELVIQRVFEQCSKLRATSAGQMHRLRFSLLGADRGQEKDATKAQGEIVVTGDMEDAEAATACAVIARLLAREMAVVVSVLERGETSLARHTDTHFLLATLSRNVLRNAAFAATLVDAEKHSLECIPIIADTQFRVPGAAFWQERAGKSTSEWPDPALLQRYETSMDAVFSSYRRLFNILAMRFSTYGSARMQATEVKELVPRFRRGAAAKMTVTPSPPVPRTPAVPPQPELVEPAGEPNLGVDEEVEDKLAGAGPGYVDLFQGDICQHYV